MLSFYVKKCKIYGQNTKLKIEVKNIKIFGLILSINLRLFDIETQNLKFRSITETVLDK